MNTDRITMSQQERDRLKVITAVLTGKMMQAGAFFYLFRVLPLALCFLFSYSGE